MKRLVFCLGLVGLLALGGQAIALPGTIDDVPAASERSPALTTVSQDHARKGRLATDLLLAQLAGNAGAEHHELPHRLVVRASTGPAP